MWSFGGAGGHEFLSSDDLLPSDVCLLSASPFQYHESVEMTCIEHGAQQKGTIILAVPPMSNQVLQGHSDIFDHH